MPLFCFWALDLFLPAFNQLYIGGFKYFTSLEEIHNMILQNCYLFLLTSSYNEIVLQLPNDLISLVSNAGLIVPWLERWFMSHKFNDNLYNYWIYLSRFSNHVGLRQILLLLLRYGILSWFCDSQTTQSTFLGLVFHFYSMIHISWVLNVFGR